MPFHSRFFARPSRNIILHDSNDDDSRYPTNNEAASWNPPSMADSPVMDPSDFASPFSNSLSFPPSRYSDEITGFMNAPVNRNQTPEAYVFKVEIPGLNKDEVKVEVRNGVLKIGGERRRAIEESNNNCYRFDSSSGRFIRMYMLPEDAKTDATTTSTENGVLTVNVPK